jgi:hypothetical protein
VLQKTPLGWATIDANWDGQIPKVDGRSTAARRAKRLAAEWVAQLGGPEVVDFVTLAKVKRAAELSGRGGHRSGHGHAGCASLRRSGPDRAPGRNLPAKLAARQAT